MKNKGTLEGLHIHSKLNMRYRIQECDQDVLQDMDECAEAWTDGHFVIMAFTTGFRVALHTPTCPIDYDDIERMPKGKGLLAAWENWIEEDPERIRKYREFRQVDSI